MGEQLGIIDFDIQIVVILLTFNFFLPEQYRVVLQSEETIVPEYRHPSKQSSGVTHTSHSTVHENCLHTKKTHVVLPIPISASPEFTSELGKLIGTHWNQ